MQKKRIAMIIAGAAGMALAAGPGPEEKAHLDARIGMLKEAWNGHCDIPADSITCRTEAVYWLAKDGGEYVLPAIAEVLEKDPYTSARAQAAEALEKIGGTAAMARLKASLRKDVSPVVRIRSAKALVNLGDRSPETVQVLAAAAKGAGRHAWSAKGFFTPNPERGLAQETAALQDRLQLEALEAVARLGTPEARAVLDSQTRSPNLTIQEAAKRLHLRAPVTGGR